MKKNMLYKLSFTFCFFLFAVISKGQNIQTISSGINCLSQTIFKTDSLGTRKEALAFPLTFTFSTDSIIVAHSRNPTKEFMSFKIEKKDTCQWNKDFTIGKTSYQLLMIYKEYTKHPKLNIIYEPSGKKYIELLYENSEERIFTIVPQQ